MQARSCAGEIDAQVRLRNSGITSLRNSGIKELAEITKILLLECSVFRFPNTLIPKFF